MDYKEEILKILNDNSNDVDNFNSAVFKEDYEDIADEIVKLFAIPDVIKSAKRRCPHIICGVKECPYIYNEDIECYH